MERIKTRLKKKPAGKMELPTSVIAERKSMCLCDSITVKIIFSPVMNFTPSTYDMVVISELLHMQSEVSEFV